MDELNPRRLTRAQLAQFLPTHDLIKAFEALFNVTGATPDEINTLTQLVEEVTLNAESAAAGQAAVVAQLQRMASALETLALAPAVEPTPVPEQYACEGCAAMREELNAMRARVEALENAP
ncbi:MAG TPA: hypothetical protein VIN03_11970 [Roseateles sp.]